MIIAVNLELGEIERDRIYVSETTGKKYLSLVLLDHRQPDPHGNDGFVAHSVSKAERDAGKKGKPVGNWKFLVRPGPPPEPKTPPAARTPRPAAADDDIF
jgi:hypothetical protein